MSASKQKIKRQGQREGGIDKREKELLEQTAKKKKARWITVSIVSVILVAVIATLILNSTILYKAANVVSCGDMKYTLADYNYYFYSTYYTYRQQIENTYGEYAAYFLPDINAPLSAQVYSSTTGETWKDYIHTQTITSMQRMSLLYAKALENGYGITDDIAADVKEAVDAIEVYAKQLGYSDVDKYISSVYGKGVDLKCYRENLEIQHVANAYYLDLYDSYEYSDDEIKDYYAAMADKRDIFSYNYYYFDGSEVSDKKDTAEDESVDADTAMANAKEKAEEFYARLEKGEDFDKLAVEFADEDEKDTYEKDGTLNEQAGESINSTYKDWVISADRKAGDHTMIKGDKGYYILQYVGRDANTYNLISVRHILVQPANSAAQYEGITEENKEILDELDLEEAKAEAEKIYEEWKKGEKTEESFAELADKYSDDSPEGGLYEHVYKNMMVKEFNDWCFDPDREVGDHEIVKTDYGYHIMYFVGVEDMRYCDYLADSELRAAEYDKWEADTLVSYKISQNWLIKFGG